MEKTPEYALEAGIAVWTADNKDVVKCALELAAVTTDLGLVDTNQNSFMGIVPTEVFGPDGNLVHECFLNINHQAWGYFRIIIRSTSHFEVISPRLTTFKNQILLSQQEVSDFIKELASSLDNLYLLEELLDKKEIRDAEKLLEKMLVEYHEAVKHELISIKEYIANFPGKMYIVSTNSDDKQYIDEIPNRYDLALQHPENWHIDFFEGFGTAKQEDKEFRERLTEFQKLENHYACRLYLAQKIVKEKSLRLSVLTDSEYPEPDISGEVLVDEAMNLTLVRPVMHCIGMRIEHDY
jgi:hypothetical protein